MQSRVVLGLTAVALAIALAGCASTAGAGSGTGGGSTGGGSAAPTPTPQSILGTWQLVSGTDATGAISPGDSTVILRLDGAHSSGQGPCNAYGASETGSTTGPISIHLGIRTMMACAEAVRNVTESRYFAALGEVAHASLAGGKLTLDGGGVSLVFTKASR
jgi:heat shock protein HslJ